MEDELKKAKVKALHLLEQMNRTEAQLRLKLKQKGFTEEAIEQAVSYVKSFGYVNDMNYAKCFVENKKHGKSKKEMQAALYQKGLRGSEIEAALEEGYEEYSEIDTIKSVLLKKRYDWENATEQEKKKYFDYLYRKGFRCEDIRQVLQVSFWNA